MTSTYIKTFKISSNLHNKFTIGLNVTENELIIEGKKIINEKFEGKFLYNEMKKYHIFEECKNINDITYELINIIEDGIKKNLNEENNKLILKIKLPGHLKEVLSFDLILNNNKI
jgi:hypothetical protein